jgi:hypothetical protein
MIYKTFEQWKSGNVLEHGVPRTEHYSEDQLDLVEMGWMYGYDAGRAVEQALDKKAENARELGLDYEPVQDSTCNETLRAQGKAYPRTCRKCGLGPCIGAPAAPVVDCHATGVCVQSGLRAEQPAPVQGPSGDYLSDFQEGQWWLAELDAAVVNGTPAQRSAVAVVRNLLATVAANTPPAAAVQEGRDWSLLEATQESLREHMIEIKRLKEAQPAVPDAMTSADIQEHIEYVAGWNDCRQAMLEMMK